jgi:hypothetical protein
MLAGDLPGWTLWLLNTEKIIAKEEAGNGTPRGRV